MIKTIIADDHLLYLKGLELTLTCSGKYKVVAAVTNGIELVEVSKKTTADLIVIDFRMPLLNGLDALLKLKEKKQTKLVFVTAHADEWLIAEAKVLNVSGVICKTADESLLISLLDKVMQGEKVFPSDEDIYNRYYEPLKKKFNLTNKEAGVIRAIRNGLDVNEIAVKSNVTTETVKKQKKNAFAKLGIKKVTLLGQLFDRL